jgi:hypothetical protein
MTSGKWYFIRVPMSGPDDALNRRGRWRASGQAAELAGKVGH